MVFYNLILILSNNPILEPNNLTLVSNNPILEPNNLTLTENILLRRRFNY
jgi:hypothetical protein